MTEHIGMQGALEVFDPATARLVAIDQLTMEDFRLICYGLAGKLEEKDKLAASNLIERILQQQQKWLTSFSASMQKAVDNFLEVTKSRS